MKRIHRNSITTIFAVIIFTVLSAQDVWVVPDAASVKTAPMLFDSSTSKAGEELYKNNCLQCHGHPGKADFIQLVPSPGDPASEKFQTNSDGDIFYKITTGRLAMPAFKDVIEEEDRWKVISFLRSFNTKYVQPIVGEKEKKAKAWVSFTIDTVKKSIIISAKGIKNNETVAIENAEVRIFVKRYFGFMPIGKAQRTDINGNLTMSFPEDIPGDTVGNISGLVRLSDDNYFGDFSGEFFAAIGKPVHKPSLTDERAMWGTMSKAPIWLYLVYGFMVIAVWSVIGSIILALFKVYKIGKNHKISTHDE